MKTPQQVTADVRRRLAGRWHADLAGQAAAFPHTFALGRPAAAELRTGYQKVHAATVALQQWARGAGVELAYETRLAAGGTRQTVPTHVTVHTLTQAALIAGGDWPARLLRGRARRAVLAGNYPQLVDLGRALRMVDGYSTLDFELLCTVADWFAADPGRARGLTPRQVPIPGVHAKWLQTHLAAVAALTGLDELALRPAHPARIHFTYLDPAHRRAGGRRHDSATVGDTMLPAYQPTVVIISENKDTAVHFPELAGGIAVEGMGRGGAAAATFDWLRSAPLVVYWGDMDADGYEILDGYRADFDRDLESICMDVAAYDTFERFGTGHDRHGRALTGGVPKPAPRLRDGERAVYLRLLDETHRGHRRIEQERIPLPVAADAVHSLAGRLLPADTTPPATGGGPADAVEEREADLYRTHTGGAEYREGLSAAAAYLRTGAWPDPP